jgi:hypothetical protein
MNVISRSAWGAAAPRQTPSRISGPVSKIFIHHTVTDSGPPEREAALMRQVQQIAFSRGFNDISYSYLIFPTGNTYEGRGFGVVGAHTEGHNSTAYALCLVGNYELEPMTDAQVEAVREMIAEGQRLGFVAADPTVRGHRAVSSTACPGGNAMARLSEVVGGTRPTSSGAGARPFPGVFLKRGSSGELVCAVQARLRDLGHSIDRVPGCPFGPQTEAAVISFQRSRALDDDGVVGPDTWALLFELVAVPA